MMLDPNNDLRNCAATHLFDTYARILLVSPFHFTLHVNIIDLVWHFFTYRDSFGPVFHTTTDKSRPIMKTVPRLGLEILKDLVDGYNVPVDDSIIPCAPTSSVKLFSKLPSSKRRASPNYGPRLAYLYSN